MKRRRALPTSSLDLFLDAISNMFGGIILLAILLSLIVQKRSQEPELVAEQGVPTSVLEANELLSELDRLDSLHTQLREAILILNAGRPKAEQVKVLDLQNELARVQEMADESIQQQIEVSRLLAQQVATTADLRQEIAEVQHQLTSVQSALQTEQLALDEALDEQLEILKLPQVETVSKSNLILLMRYGKVYVAYENDGTTPNSNHVTVTPLGLASKITPKMSTGLDLNRSEDIVELNIHLDRNSTNYSILSVAVWPDSFRDFGQLRQIALDKGFQYQLWPLGDVPALLVSPSDQLPRVQ